MKEVVTKVIDTLTQEDFHGDFKILLERYNKCIAAGEDYFEKGLEFHMFTINKSAHTKKCLQTYLMILIYIDLVVSRELHINKMMCKKEVPWCYGYRRRKWTRRHEFKSWTKMIEFHIALIPLGKVWIQLFSLQL